MTIVFLFNILTSYVLPLLSLVFFILGIIYFWKNL